MIGTRTQQERGRLPRHHTQCFLCTRFFHSRENPTRYYYYFQSIVMEGKEKWNNLPQATMLALHKEAEKNMRIRETEMKIHKPVKAGTQVIRGRKKPARHWYLGEMGVQTQDPSGSNETSVLGCTHKQVEAGHTW